MPVYIYECKKCNHSFEEFKTFSTMKDPFKNPCPQCKKKNCIELGLTAPAAFLSDTNLRPPAWFKDRMKQIGDKHPRNNIGHHY